MNTLRPQIIPLLLLILSFFPIISNTIVNNPTSIIPFVLY